MLQKKEESVFEFILVTINLTINSLLIKQNSIGLYRSMLIYFCNGKLEESLYRCPQYDVFVTICVITQHRILFPFSFFLCSSPFFRSFFVLLLFFVLSFHFFIVPWLRTITYIKLKFDVYSLIIN